MNNLACLQAAICILVAILDGWKSEDLGLGAKTPPTHDFSGQKVKSCPAADSVFNWLSRCQKNNKVSLILMVRVGHARDITTELHGDVKGVISRVSSFLDPRRTADILKPEKETAVISLLRGEDCPAVLHTGKSLLFTV